MHIKPMLDLVVYTRYVWFNLCFSTFLETVVWPIYDSALSGVKILEVS
jgi:hypothetical protein